MVKDTTYYFAVTLLVAESEVKNVYKILNSHEYTFKVKVLILKDNIEPTVKSMRKIIK